MKKDGEVDRLYRVISEQLEKAEKELQILKEAVIAYSDNHEPLSLYSIDGGELERKIDGLVFVNSWIIDRLGHVNPNSKKSYTHKIRKALGYNC